MPLQDKNCDAGIIKTGLTPGPRAEIPQHRRTHEETKTKWASEHNEPKMFHPRQRENGTRTPKDASTQLFWPPLNISPASKLWLASRSTHPSPYGTARWHARNLSKKPASHLISPPQERLHDSHRVVSRHHLRRLAKDHARIAIEKEQKDWFQCETRVSRVAEASADNTSAYSWTSSCLLASSSPKPELLAQAGCSLAPFCWPSRRSRRQTTHYFNSKNIFEKKLQKKRGPKPISVPMSPDTQPKSPSTNERLNSKHEQNQSAPAVCLL